MNLIHDNNKGKVPSLLTSGLSYLLKGFRCIDHTVLRLSLSPIDRGLNYESC